MATGSAGIVGTTVDITGEFTEQGEEQGYLVLKPGDRVLVQHAGEDGWFFGRHASSSKSGWFPASIVDRPAVEANGDGSASVSEPDAEDGAAQPAAANVKVGATLMIERTWDDAPENCGYMYVYKEEYVTVEAVDETGSGWAYGRLHDSEVNAQGWFPLKVFVPLTEEAALQESREEAKRQRRKQEETPSKLNELIKYLEEEVAVKFPPERLRADASGADADIEGYGLTGQEALDAYMADLVAIIRDYPFDELSGDKTIGCWVRDEVVAPCFLGSWDFYGNRKLKKPLDLSAIQQLIAGERMLLHRLRYARDDGGL